MDDDFFSGGPPQTITPGYQSNIPHNNVDDQFDFGDNQYQYETPVIHTHQSNHSRSNEPYVSYSSNNIDTHESEAILKMREEEQKVMQRLRQKSDQQFEKKRVRKEEGQKQLEQFMERKYQQTLSRKQENKQKQQRKIEQFAKLSQESGWKKVAVSVPLKQGQHKGQKQINRMREAIINKKQDQS